jgi:hypothetical protein
MSCLYSYAECRYAKYYAECRCVDVMSTGVNSAKTCALSGVYIGDKTVAVIALCLKWRFQKIDFSFKSCR